MNKFYIDIEYATSVATHQVYYITKKEDESEEDFLVRKLKNPDPVATMTGSEDHPEFTKLREQLGKEGFISIERGWSNGDRVLKPFTLNNVKFKKGYKFFCAAAMKYTLEHGTASF